MAYLILMFVIAAIGIGMLWWQQRKQVAHVDSVDGFRKGMQAISPQRRISRRPAPTAGPQRRPSLDPDRREAARRRIEARRREALARAHRRAS